MTNTIHPEKSTGHGGYERRDVGITGVLYFLLGLALFCLIAYFLMKGLFSYLDRQSENQQAPVNPLVTGAARDTRHLPPDYDGDYQKYLQKNFPSPQLEIDERNQLEKVRLAEDQTLSTYDWVDEKAGTVRIPIDRAIDLVVQRGLPVRAQASTPEPPAGSSARNTKGTMQ